MRFQDLCEKIKSGEITIDVNGHEPYHGDTLLDWYQEQIDITQGSMDGKWYYKAEETAEERAKGDADMREHSQLQLNYKVVEGNLNYQPDTRCHRCGKRLFYVLFDKTFRACSANFKGLATKPEVIDQRCECAEKLPLSGEIQVKSKKLLFVNFFPHIEDHPEDGHGEEWSLNNYIGRKNITKYRADQNVAYGQMGNMSVGIFVHPNKKSIIVGDAYIDETRLQEMEEEEAEAICKDKKRLKELATIEGHVFKDRISLGMWRWEATDKKNVNKEQLKDIVEERRQDTVSVVVEPGTWYFEHYYGTDCPQDNEIIYARLTLKE